MSDERSEKRIAAVLKQYSEHIPLTLRQKLSEGRPAAARSGCHIAVFADAEDEAPVKKPVENIKCAVKRAGIFPRKFSHGYKGTSGRAVFSRRYGALQFAEY